MPYRNRRGGMGLRPVNSLKHIVDTNGSVSAGTQSITDVVNTVDNPAAITSNQVNTGCKVNAIYLRVEVKGRVTAGGVDNIYMYVYKNPGANLGNPPADSVGTNDNRRYVIHQEMLMTSPFDSGTNTAFPRTLFKGVILIPRGYRRMGVNDKLQVVLQHRAGEATQTTEFCLQCIYKEYQ